VQGYTKAHLREASKSLERERYRSAENFERERERIFAGRWTCVGREEHLAEPGDFVLVEIAGESLILTRSRDGEIRAFYNVCRHRGTRLCAETSGRFAGAIQCPYHAWTYGLDGTLLTARNMSDIATFDRSELSLHEAAVARWGGFLFVSLATEPQSFESALPALDRRFEPWNLSSLRTAHTIAYEIACDWKLIFQNYSECYHCPVIHPQLEALSASDSGRNDLHDGAVLGGYSTLRMAHTSLTTTGTTSRRPLGSLGGADLERIYYYTVFPSMLLSLHADYVLVHYVQPLGVARTRVVCAWLAEASTVNEGIDLSDAVDFWDLTNRQDWAVCERTQLGVSSRAYVPGPYAQSEGLLAAFDRHYLSALGSAIH
jgi:Rieske 2Fe-2S family protein